MGQNNKRNIYVDVIRGIAMLMVIMGHTMTGCTLESQNSFLFNIIWSLQMPLFILISGYVTKYSRGCYDVHSLGKFVRRRSLAYLLPWVVWTFVIRGVIFGHSHFTEPLWVVYNMDSGYWFLFTIWIISMCFGLAEYVSKRFAHNVQREFVVTTVVFGILGGVLLFVGMFMGLKFLGIKLTVYYMSFYWLGYLYWSFGDKIDSVKYGTVFTNVVITISAFVWIYFMRNVNLFEMSDNGISVLLRMICSITGCVTICGLCKGLFVFVECAGNQTVMIRGAGVVRCPLVGTLSRSILDAQYASDGGEATVLVDSGNDNNAGKLCLDNDPSHNGHKVDKSKQVFEIHSIREKIESFFLWAGKHSLEIYLCHGFVLNILKYPVLPCFSEIPGLTVVLCNYILTILLLAIIINLLNSNKLLKFVLFGSR